jgi:cold shock CspA family protein
MRHQGRITAWKDDKGFGFITPNGSRDQVFVHIGAFAHAGRRPTGQELVTYELTVDERNRARAERVAFVDDARRTGAQGAVTAGAASQVPAARTAAPQDNAPGRLPPPGKAPSRRFRRTRNEPRRSGGRTLRRIALALTIALGVAGYGQYEQHRVRDTDVEAPVAAPARVVQGHSEPAAPPPPGSVRVVPRAAPAPAAPGSQPIVPRTAPPAAPAGSVAVVPREPAKYRCDGRTHCSQMHSCEEATWFLNHCPGTKMDGDGDGIPCERQWC